MSRYRGPRVRVLRALGTELPGLTSKKLDRRPYPPGQHGQKKKKVTEYGRRLMEKQKLRMNYGIGERQLRRLVVEARTSKSATGAKLLELLERRLDNALFRAGFARTIPNARQLICHGHVLVDGARVDIPSYRVAVGERIALRERSQHLVGDEESRPDLQTPAWLSVERPEKAVVVGLLPDETSVPFPIDVRLVVEFYSQRI